MNFLEGIISTLAPSWGAKRIKSRLKMLAYDAADTTGRTRKVKRERRSGNAAVRYAGVSLREQARWLDENHDLVTGICDTFCANVVGANGISIEPMPKKKDGSIHEEFAEQLTHLHDDWSKRPEVTGELSRGQMERMIALTWFRDGECFSQHIQGSIPTLNHLTKVPYSIELIEPDMIPFDHTVASENIVQGIQCNAWNRPVTYWAYKQHPGDLLFSTARDLKPIPAANMSHIKTSRRIGQRRGITRLASVISRLEDIKDYEESERVAARIAAAMAAYIKKGTPDQFDDSVDADGNRQFDIAPGIVWDDLEVGEDVGTIQSNRPSNLLNPFRDAMLKAVASGTGTGYSSIAKSYDGTFASQRQELVEQFVIYSTNTAAFISSHSVPTYERFVRTAIVSMDSRIPADLDLDRVIEADYRGPVMPWIDPVKEATGQVIQARAGFKPRSQIIRERGGNPNEVYRQYVRERQRDYKDGMFFDSDIRSSDSSVYDELVKLLQEDDSKRKQATG